MWKWALIGILALFLAGCDSQPTRKAKHKKQVQEESQQDPYQQNAEESDESDESQDPQKGYFDPLRDIKDVKKQHDEELQKEKEVIDEADNQK